MLGSLRISSGTSLQLRVPSPIYFALPLSQTKGNMPKARESPFSQAPNSEGLPLKGQSVKGNVDAPHQPRTPLLNLSPPQMTAPGSMCPSVGSESRSLICTQRAHRVGWCGTKCLLMTCPRTVSLNEACARDTNPRAKGRQRRPLDILRNVCRCLTGPCWIARTVCVAGPPRDT